MKLLTHKRDTKGDFQKRVLIHIPVGLIIGIPVFGWVLGYLFVAYEENEDLHTKDQAWKDYFGAMVGCGFGIFISIGLIIWAIWS